MDENHKVDGSKSRYLVERIGERIKAQISTFKGEKPENIKSVIINIFESEGVSFEKVKTLSAKFGIAKISIGKSVSLSSFLDDLDEFAESLSEGKVSEAGANYEEKTGNGNRKLKIALDHKKVQDLPKAEAIDYIKEEIATTAIAQGFLEEELHKQVSEMQFASVKINTSGKDALESSAEIIYNAELEMAKANGSGKKDIGEAVKNSSEATFGTNGSNLAPKTSSEEQNQKI